MKLLSLSLLLAGIAAAQARVAQPTSRKAFVDPVPLCDVASKHGTTSFQTGKALDWAQDSKRPGSYFCQGAGQFGEGINDPVFNIDITGSRGAVHTLDLAVEWAPARVIFRSERTFEPFVTDLFGAARLAVPDGMIDCIRALCERTFSGSPFGSVSLVRKDVGGLRTYRLLIDSR